MSTEERPQQHQGIDLYNGGNLDPETGLSLYSEDTSTSELEDWDEQILEEESEPEYEDWNEASITATSYKAAYDALCEDCEAYEAITKLFGDEIGLSDPGEQFTASTENGELTIHNTDNGVRLDYNGDDAENARTFPKKGDLGHVELDGPKIVPETGKKEALGHHIKEISEERRDLEMEVSSPEDAVAIAAEFLHH